MKKFIQKKTSPKISSRFDRYVNDIFAIRYALLLRQNGKNLKIYIDDVYLLRVDWELSTVKEGFNQKFRCVHHIFIFAVMGFKNDIN
jgi:hypothetical protein